MASVYASKQELVNWVNGALGLRLARLEQFGNGAAFCQVLDAFYPTAIPMHKVNFFAREDYEVICNWKLLQAGFSTAEITRDIDVFRLSKGQPAEVLELLQFLSKHLRRKQPVPEYDPIARRASSVKGGTSEIPVPRSCEDKDFDLYGRGPDLAKFPGTWGYQEPPTTSGGKGMGSPRPVSARTRNTYVPSGHGKIDVSHVTSKWREGLAPPVTTPSTGRRRYAQVPTASGGGSGGHHTADHTHRNSSGTQTDMQSDAVFDSTAESAPPRMVVQARPTTSDAAVEANEQSQPSTPTSKRMMRDASTSWGGSPPPAAAGIDAATGDTAWALSQSPASEQGTPESQRYMDGAAFAASPEPGLMQGARALSSGQQAQAQQAVYPHNKPVYAAEEEEVEISVGGFQPESPAVPAAPAANQEDFAEVEAQEEDTRQEAIGVDTLAVHGTGRVSEHEAFGEQLDLAPTAPVQQPAAEEGTGSSSQLNLGAVELDVIASDGRGAQQASGALSPAGAAPSLQDAMASLKEALSGAAQAEAAAAALTAAAPGIPTAASPRLATAAGQAAVIAAPIAPAAASPRGAAGSQATPAQMTAATSFPAAASPRSAATSSAAAAASAPAVPAVPAVLPHSASPGPVPHVASPQPSPRQTKEVRDRAEPAGDASAAVTRAAAAAKVSLVSGVESAAGAGGIAQSHGRKTTVEDKGTGTDGSPSKAARQTKGAPPPASLPAQLVSQLPPDAAALLASAFGFTGSWLPATNMEAMAGALETAAHSLAVVSRSSEALRVLLQQQEADVAAGKSGMAVLDGACAGGEAGGEVGGPTRGKLRSMQDAVHTLLRHTGLLLADVAMHSSNRPGGSSSAVTSSEEGGEEDAAKLQAFAARAALLQADLQSHETAFAGLSQRLAALQAAGSRRVTQDAGAGPRDSASAGSTSGAAAGGTFEVPASPRAAGAGANQAAAAASLGMGALDAALKAVGLAQFALVQGIHKEIARLTSLFLNTQVPLVQQQQQASAGAGAGGAGSGQAGSAASTPRDSQRPATSTPGAALDGGAPAAPASATPPAPSSTSPAAGVGQQAAGADAVALGSSQQPKPASSSRAFKLGEFQLKQLRNGDVYKGRYVGSRKEGDGVYHFVNGDVYEGEFRDDRMDGYGVYTFSHEGRYEGCWRAAVYNGAGTETFAKGSTYHGQYSGGLRNGWGVCRFYNGDYYEGQWSRGLRDGRGMQQCTDESNYVGDYSRGKRHGVGVYVFPNGDKYAGQYADDLPHGYGVYSFATGQRYEGEWRTGRKHGWSVYTVETGARWVAQWVDGKPQFVQAFDAAESAGGSGLEGAAGSEAHPQGLSTLDARTLAQHASHQACRAADDAGQRQAEHWAPHGPVQPALRAAVASAERAAAQAQAARGRALELAMRLDMAVALMRSNELGGVAGMGPLPPLGPLAPGSVVTGGSLATSTAPSAAGGVSMGGGHGLGAAPPSPPVSSGGFSHRG